MRRELIGEQLGNYTLVRLLGRGGFAEVYLGQHVRLDMQAAVKILHTHLADEEIADFHREAQVIAKLVHPHIVRILDFDVKDGTPFLVLDYAPHGTLRQQHPRGKQVPLSTIVTYVNQIADALQEAVLQEPPTQEQAVSPAPQPALPDTPSPPQQKATGASTRKNRPAQPHITIAGLLGRTFLLLLGAIGGMGTGLSAGQSTGISEIGGIIGFFLGTIIALLIILRLDQDPSTHARGRCCRISFQSGSASSPNTFAASCKASQSQ